jgi:hypothetical protein
MFCGAPCWCMGGEKGICPMNCCGTPPYGMGAPCMLGAICMGCIMPGWRP